MNAPAEQLLMMGLAEAGKTSFIHAVDDLLRHPPSDKALRLAGLAVDRTVLNKDKADFRSGNKIQRTERNPSGAPPELWFEDPTSGRKGRLFLPDASGEIYRDHWEIRMWDKAFADGLPQISGVLLFARADLPASNAELLGKLVDPKRPPGTLVAWDPKKASTQVQLVDNLQFLAECDRIKHPLRITVIFSAWDTMKQAGQFATKPDAFLQKDWALLGQYLANNPELFTFRTYGVSARGGTEAQMTELRKLAPTDRVMIVDGDETDRDLTRPIRWLLQLG